MVRTLIRFLTTCLLLTALGGSAWWYHTQDKNLEPAVTFFILLATILGVFADRWAAQKEHDTIEKARLVAEQLRAEAERQRTDAASRREQELRETEARRRVQLLQALLHEACVNLKAFQDPMFYPQKQVHCPAIYPRMAYFGIEAVLTSGSFTGGQDVLLFTLLQDCRTEFARCNQIVGLLENASAVSARSPAQQATIHNDLFRDGAVVTRARGKLIALTERLKTHYASETGLAESSRELSEARDATDRDALAHATR